MVPRPSAAAATAAAANDADIGNLARSVDPPPYSEGNYDLTPTPQSVNRPRLPEDRRNQYLRDLPEDITIVKFQTIVREGKEIIVGRIKVPTPGANSHAFILRRYDTNAISLTTMFKVAFPGASEEDEKREMDWVRSSYDTRNTNGSRDCNAVRLAGQWVSRHLAIHLAPAYGLSDLVLALARAAPDPNVSYRKSQRSQAAAEDLARQRTTTQQHARPAPSMETPAAEVAAPTPKRARRTTEGTPDATPSGGSGGESSRRVTVEAVTTVTAPAGAVVDMNAEIESAKQLVRDLKRDLQMRAAAGEQLVDTGMAEGESSSRGQKRLQGDDDVEISSGASGERIIRRNRRVEQHDGPVETVKRVAFGALLFGLGAGAALALPQLANFL